MSDFVWVKYATSPVRILNCDGTAHTLLKDVGNGISAIETFPATCNEGLYSLELRKEVTDSEQIQPTRDDLVACLKEFSLVWTFAGGSRMDLQAISVQTSPKYSTNANELLKEMLARKGTARLSHAINLQATIIGTYSVYPLESATILVQSMRGDFHLRMMLEYLNEARLDDRAWFLHLYKIRDTLCHAADKHQPDSKRFGVSEKEWDKFGRILNTEYDLRHAAKEGQVSSISREEKNQVFEIGINMIKKYMDFKDVPYL